MDTNPDQEFVQVIGGLIAFAFAVFWLVFPFILLRRLDAIIKSLEKSRMEAFSESQKHFRVLSQILTRLDPNPPKLD